MVWSQAPRLPSIQTHKLNKCLLCISAQSVVLFEQWKGTTSPSVFFFSSSKSLEVVCVLFLHTLTEATFQMLSRVACDYRSSGLNASAVSEEEGVSTAVRHAQSNTENSEKLYQQKHLLIEKQQRQYPRTSQDSWVSGLIATKFTSTEVRQISVEKGL